MENRYVLISFLGDTEYENSEYNFKKLKEYIDIKDSKKKYLCSFEALKKNINLEKIYLFLTDEAEEIFENTCDKNDERIEIKKIDEKDSFGIILEKFLEVIRKISKDYKNNTVIIDLTHSFRHFTMLKLLSTLMANFLLNDFRFYIVYAKKEGDNKYKFIEIREYIDYYQLFQAVEYFIDDLYVPEFFYKNLLNYQNKSNKEKTVELLFKELYELGKSIRENVINPKDKEAIWDLSESILDKVKSLEKQVDFLKEVNKYEKGREFKNILEKISSLKYKEEYEQLLELAELTFNKKLLLNSAIYLMEGMNEFIYWKFRNTKLIKSNNRYLTPKEYEREENKYETLKVLKKIAKYKLGKNNPTWKKFGKHLKEIDEIRNNMAHVFRNITPQSYENKIEKILSNVKNLINQLKED